MDDGIEIGELVHTISLLRRTQEYTPARPPHSLTELKHLSLLDEIALLMAMGNNSDVLQSRIGKRLQTSPFTTQPTVLIQIDEVTLKKLQVRYAV